MHEFAAEVNVYRGLLVSFFTFVDIDSASKWRSEKLILWARCLTLRTFSWEESLKSLVLMF